MCLEAKQNKLQTRLGWLPIILVCWPLASCGPAEWRSKGGEPESKAGETAAPQALGKSEPALDPLPLPEWAKVYIGQDPRKSFPRNGLCVGNTDAVESRVGGAAPGTSILGWGWDNRAKARVNRVILVDINYRIVGAGEGGLPRGDVPKALPEIPDANTGWRAVTRLTAGPINAYGVVDGGQAICPLGRLEF